MEKEVNVGGRPPYYVSGNPDDEKKVAELCNEYFELLIPLPGNPVIPPLVTGLALHLGFDSKNTLYDYAKKEGFSDSIKRALTRIESHHELQAAYGDKCTGNIFVLKNFGWKDTQEIDHKGHILNEPPKIQFVDTDE